MPDDFEPDRPRLTVPLRWHLGWPWPNPADHPPEYIDKMRDIAAALAIAVISSSVTDAETRAHLMRGAAEALVARTKDFAGTDWRASDPMPAHLQEAFAR